MLIDGMEMLEVRYCLKSVEFCGAEGNQWVTLNKYVDLWNEMQGSHAYGLVY